MVGSWIVPVALSAVIVCHFGYVDSIGNHGQQDHLIQNMAEGLFCKDNAAPRYINFITTGKTGTKLTMTMIHDAYGPDRSRVTINYPTHHSPTDMNIAKIQNSWKMNNNNSVKFWPVIHLMRDPIDVALSMHTTPLMWLEHMVVNYHFDKEDHDAKLKRLSTDRNNDVMLTSDFLELGKHITRWESVDFPVLKIMVKFNHLNDSDVKSAIRKHLCLRQDYKFPDKDANIVLPPHRIKQAEKRHKKLERFFEKRKKEHKTTHLRNPTPARNNMHHGATRDDFLSNLTAGQREIFLSVYRQASLDFQALPKFRVSYPKAMLQ